MLGRPVALAPEPGGPQVIGETSGAAEAFGVRAGMRLAEALGRCPALVLAPADPVRAEAAWEGSLRRLEGIGAAVEAARPGTAFFAVEPLLGIHGDVAAVLRRARRALGPPARFGAGPTRLAARAAAGRMRARRPAPVVSGPAAHRLVDGLPVGALREALAGGSAGGSRDAAWERAQVPDTLERLGVRTLGELAALPAAAVADRFGDPGLRAWRLARGDEEPLRPRAPGEELFERVALPEAASGEQLGHALRLLVERLLAHPARAERTIRALRLEARLAAGGGWRSDVVLRRASANPERLRLALEPRLGRLPGPVAALGLRARDLGDRASGQEALVDSPAEERREHLAEAVRQARAAAGRDAIVQVIEVERCSRVPERRMLLAPFGERRR